MCSKIRGFLFADLAYVVDWFSELVFLLILERYRGRSVFVRIACPTVRKILRIIRQFAFRCNCESFENIHSGIGRHLLTTNFRFKYLYCEFDCNLNIVVY
jgi:hypothetical protein